MAEFIELTAADGFKFPAYEAHPSGTPKGALVVCGMTSPSEATVETIRGNPDLKDELAADLEHEQLILSGFGQPFLIAVKLRGEEGVLVLRVHLIFHLEPSH